MPRTRVEYPGAIYRVMSRGDGQEVIFRGHVDRQDFVKTLAETCEKMGFQAENGFRPGCTWERGGAPAPSYIAGREQTKSFMRNPDSPLPLVARLVSTL